MKLYHISRTRISSLTFSPRRPKYHNKLENSTIPRISVSESIEGCISAVNMWLGTMKSDSVKFDDLTEAWVYEFDSDDVLPENLLSPRYIKDNYFIFDSLYTKEYWIINQSIKPTREYLI